ncbi:MAG TPA: hypothetical protein VLF94_04545, partial [Chlamydiales bacterium]|nr:hypothetical protein [Chlamydiales bacterium]
MTYISGIPCSNRFDVLATLDEEGEPNEISESQAAPTASPSEAKPTAPRSSLKKMALAVGSCILLIGGGLPYIQDRQIMNDRAPGIMNDRAPPLSKLGQPLELIIRKQKLPTNDGRRNPLDEDLYSLYPKPEKCTISGPTNSYQHIQSFIECHKNEFLAMTRSRFDEKYHSKFTVLGEGISKVAVSHEDFPGYVFKVPLHPSSASDLKKHVEGAEAAENAIQTCRYKNIMTTKPLLFKNDTLIIVAEPKMSFIPYKDAARLIPEEELLAAEEELCHFAYNTSNTDLILYRDHNAGFVYLDGRYKICIYDFDHAGCEKLR